MSEQPTLRRGDSGTAVREMKGGLCAAGCLSAALVNSEFDFDTVEAVRDFQRKSGLEETGEFDAETRRALNKRLMSKG
jgi:peptidoglycan hydrolase-like protein with peptidoglycan-binding domain